MSGDVQGGLVGLGAGLLCGGGGLWVGVRAARRSRGVDERLRLAALRGVAKGWGLTGLALVGAFVWGMLGHPTVVEVVSLIYLVHLAGAATMFVWQAARL